jgi:tetratricopeptide (TPR) repeat protein
LYLKTKRYAEAEPIFWRLVTADSTFLPGWNNLGNIYRKTNRYDESEKMYRKAFALDAEFMPTYRNYARLKIKTGDLQIAFSYLEQAIQKGYDDYQGMQTDENLALLREQKERWEALMKKYFPDKGKE